jgi:hypothetical protein
VTREPPAFGQALEFFGLEAKRCPGIVGSAGQRKLAREGKLKQLFTTLGPKTEDELGMILPHEHVFVDLRRS